MGARRGRAPARRVWWIRATAEHTAWRWRNLFDEHVAGEPYYYQMGATLSRKCAREADAGDLVVCYMGGEGYREVQGLAAIVAGDVRDERGRIAVDVRPALWLDRPVPRRALVAHPVLAAAPFFRIRRGTMFPVSPAEWARVRDLIVRANPGVRRAIAGLERGGRR